MEESAEPDRIEESCRLPGTNDDGRLHPAGHRLSTAFPTDWGNCLFLDMAALDLSGPDLLSQFSRFLIESQMLPNSALCRKPTPGYHRGSRPRLLRYII
jgi:hypothetical protein